MASMNTKRIQTLEVTIENKPGTLAKVFNAFREANVNIYSHWAYETGPNQSKAIFYVQDYKKTQETLSQLGYKPQTGEACYAEGDDRIGYYSDLLNKIANANVNIMATDAFGANGKFATVFYVESKYYGDLCKAMGC